MHTKVTENLIFFSKHSAILITSLVDITLKMQYIEVFMLNIISNLLLFIYCFVKIKEAKSNNLYRLEVKDKGKKFEHTINIREIK